MARVDVRATAASGVWRSPQPLPLAHLAVTVNASDSGDVLIFWTQPINVAPPPPGVAADGSLGIGQAATFDTGLTSHGTVYVCDALGRAVDVTLAGSDAPISAAQSSPYVTPPPTATEFACNQRNGPGWKSGEYIPVPAGTLSVLVSGPSEPMAVVAGVDSGIWYYAGPMGGAYGCPTVVCPVSALMDRSLIILIPNSASPNNAGWVVPLLAPYVPQPLTVLTPSPLPIYTKIRNGSVNTGPTTPAAVTVNAGETWVGVIGAMVRAAAAANTEAVVYTGPDALFIAANGGAAGGGPPVVFGPVYLHGPTTIGGYTPILNAGRVWASGYVY